MISLSKVGQRLVSFTKEGLRSFTGVDFYHLRKLIIIEDASKFQTIIMVPPIDRQAILRGVIIGSLFFRKVTQGNFRIFQGFF